MSRTNYTRVGELLFRATDGAHVLIYTYRGKDTFKLRRMGDVVDEKINADVYKGDLNGYASEASLKWPDLVRMSVEVHAVDQEYFGRAAHIYNG